MWSCNSDKKIVNKTGLTIIPSITPRVRVYRELIQILFASVVYLRRKAGEMKFMGLDEKLWLQVRVR
jgi:hypothetical protein